MGNSASINDLAKTDEDFQKWIAQKKKELNDESNELNGIQEKSIKSYNNINGYTDSTLVLSGTSNDFMQEEDWSLANLKAVVDTIGKTIFGLDNGPTVAGAKVNKEAGKNTADAIIKAEPSLGKGGDGVKNLEMYIASKVFEILSGVLLNFGHSTNLSYAHSYKSKPLGYGLQLFCTVAGASYQSRSFFTKKNIFQYLYIYELRYSATQALAEGSRSAVKRFTDQIATFSKQAENLLNEVTDGSMTGEQYLEQVAIYNVIIQRAQDGLKNLVQDKTSTPLTLGLIALEGDNSSSPPVPSDEHYSGIIKALTEVLLKKNAIVAYKKVDSVDVKAYHIMLKGLENNLSVEQIADSLNKWYPTPPEGGTWTGDIHLN